MIQKTLVDTEEAAQAILEYIGSEDFDKAEKAIEDNGRAGLMSGLALSFSVILAKCTKYIYTIHDRPVEPVSDAYKSENTTGGQTDDAMPSEAPVG